MTNTTDIATHTPLRHLGVGEGDEGHHTTTKETKPMRPDQQMTILPEDAEERKKFPIFTGAYAYFPNAIALVARCSWEGNQQHHPEKPLHWDQAKSTDEVDALMRHIAEGEWDKVAWRALAQCEREVAKGWKPQHISKP